jgi:hypothetical protein
MLKRLASYSTEREANIHPSHTDRHQGYQSPGSQALGAETHQTDDGQFPRGERLSLWVLLMLLLLMPVAFELSQ